MWYIYKFYLFPINKNIYIKVSILSWYFGKKTNIYINIVLLILFIKHLLIILTRIASTYHAIPHLRKDHDNSVF